MTNPPQGDTVLLTHPVAETLLTSTELARLALRPSWVGVLDFETRFPGAPAGGPA